MKSVPLPIDVQLAELVASLEQTSSLVLKAAPGSGKTTRVPPALLSARFTQGSAREILVLEPRRLAAKYSAQRVAQELGETVGQTVGYQFRFENVGSPATRLRYLTEGMLLRRLQGDSQLKNVAAVLLDEFHERHLMTDAALAVLKSLQATTRPDLRIVVMSATLDTNSVATFLNNAPIFEVHNRPYPVTVSHLAAASQKPLELLVRDAVRRSLDAADHEGDILVFLPGMAEIRRAEQALDDAFASERKTAPLILPLHGELIREAQDRAIQREKGGRRKVILSTNVAETSLTIEGVTVVIDSGLHRQATYSWWSGLPALRTKAISRASAVQRMGRAGRTAPGHCHRLYTQGDFDARPPFETPEISRADLTQTLLEFKSLGLDNERGEIRWFEAPAPTSLESSWRLLYLLGALDQPTATAKLTEVGHALSRLPAHPRLGRLLIEGARLGVLEDAARLAALVSEGGLEKMDALDNLSLPYATDTLKRSREQLLRAANALPSAVRAPRTAAGLATKEDRLRFALLTAFPDRLARVRKTASSVARNRATDAELIFCEGGSAQIEETALSHVLFPKAKELLVVLDVQEFMNQGRTRTQVRSVTPVREEWLIDLEPTLLAERDDYAWDDARKRVSRTARFVYGELVLSESSAAAEPGVAAAKVLAKGALGTDFDRLSQASPADWTEALSVVADREALANAFARAELLHKYFPGESAVEAPALALRASLAQCVSAEELRALDWPEAILAAWSPERAARAEQLLPSMLTLPTGRRARIHYSSEKPPWVESRLQDFFGMKSAPALLNGRLPLTVHLLAPNQRALQVTTDLAGFWSREYPELRRALSRRYPRHAWPEDPLNVPKPAKT